MKLKDWHIRVYIASPYTADNVRDVQANVNKAIEAYCELCRLGFYPYIPHLTHYVWIHPSGDFPYDHWLEQDIEWLKLCHAVLRLPGESVGADREVQKAEALGIPVFYDISSLVEYIKQGYQTVARPYHETQEQRREEENG